MWFLFEMVYAARLKKVMKSDMLSVFLIRYQYLVNHIMKASLPWRSLVPVESCPQQVVGFPDDTRYPGRPLCGSSSNPSSVHLGNFTTPEDKKKYFHNTGRNFKLMQTICFLY